MARENPVPLAGWEIHGFHTSADLDIEKLMEDALKRWLRPNEVHAILSNHTHFKIQPQPVNTPPNGTLLLFDRKMLRNFRKDGHNWRKKKDGKTIQEAHEKLKISNEERIHVYYSRHEDDPNFHRRCYWLLDKNLERIVLVHYRQTSEECANQHLSTPMESTEALPMKNTLHHGSPLTPLNSASCSTESEMSGTAVLSGEINSGEDYAIYTGSGISPVRKSTEFENEDLSFDDLNTLDWEDLVEQPIYIDSAEPRKGYASTSNKLMAYELRETQSKDQKTTSPLSRTANPNVQVADFQMFSCDGNDTPEVFVSDPFQTLNNFVQWDYNIDDSPGSLDRQNPNNHAPNVLALKDQDSIQEEVFSITEVSPAWAYSSEETKVILIGYFHESHKHLVGSNVSCVFGGTCVPAEMIQFGVYRTMSKPNTPGLVDLYLTLDGHTPISQIVNFEYRSVMTIQSEKGVSSPEVNNNNSKQRYFEVLARLSHLLFSTTNSISIFSSRISPKALKEARKFASLTSTSLAKNWMHLLRLIETDVSSFSSANQNLFELVLKNKLQDWLLHKVAEGCKATPRDHQGQSAIHLCAILDYAWAVPLFSLSGLSLDFRDAFGWTALHWAAHCGREKMVAALLSAGANASLVTHPTPKSPGGFTAADLASQEGYEGLAAYLAEKGLTDHFRAMTLSGNIVGPLPPSSTYRMNSMTKDSENLTEEELCLKDSLAAYRNAADAAGRIQAAFRERSLKQQMKAAQFSKPETEVANIIAALKIQKAYRNYNRLKVMRAAARIQGTFRTWQARKNFLNIRQHAIKIQAVFRGHQVRKQYHRIIWSVGVLEKAVLRWRLKRKGFRGLQVESVAGLVVQKEDNSVEEDFLQIGREQAEERVGRSVIRVQAMFRSFRAQQEYRRMKLAYDQAKLEYAEHADPSQHLTGDVELSTGSCLR